MENIYDILKERDLIKQITFEDEFKDKPVGINSITSYLNESKKTVEDIVEKYLIELSFIKRTFKGRIITKKGINYLYKN